MNDELHGDDAARVDVTGLDHSSGTAGGSVERTGVPSVDRVLADVQQVGELPVAERVAVFEQVHERLRRSLDADPSSDSAGA
jgi:hypothetical protein